MSVVFDADQEPAATRLEHWRHLMDETLGPLDLRPPESDHLPQRLVIGDVGAVRVTEMHIDGVSPSTSCRAARTARIVRQADLEDYRIDLVMRGQMMVEQDGRQARLGPGDLAVVDMARPARWIVSAERSVAVMFPRALLPLPWEEVTGLTGVRIPGDKGIGALLSTFAQQLVRHLDDYGAADGTRLGTAVVDLLAAALSARSDHAPPMPPHAHQRALLLRIHAFIDQRLGDPTLSPDTIATAHHISRRYLYKLFERQEHSVARWIQQRRLERARRDLLDPAQVARPVNAIAARWGMPDAAHFNRMFRAAYGVPPGEYRLMGNGSATSGGSRAG